MNHFIECLQAYGVQLPEGPFGSRRISSMEHCRELLAQAGLDSINTELVQVGYHLQSETDWWEVVTSTGIRAFYEQVPNSVTEVLTAKVQKLAANIS